MSSLLSITLSLLILLLTLSHSLLIVQSSLNPDFESLLAFKTASDPSKKLTTWKNNTNPCSWTGVSCDKDRVTRLVLENLNLQGSIESLTSLTQLRVLSLKGNRFSGQVPNLPNLTSLKLLFLSHNHFSSEFPVTLTSLFRLYRLDLSYNNFSDEIPVTVNHLPHTPLAITIVDHYLPHNTHNTYAITLDSTVTIQTLSHRNTIHKNNHIIGS